MARITYCMMTFNRLYEVAMCIERVQPYVDRVVIVDGGSNDDTILTLRNWKGVELYIHPWKDNFSEQRTNYLKHAGEENGGTDWIIVSDPDELFFKETCEKFRELADKYSKTKYNMLAFESNSVTMLGKTIINSGNDNYWKGLMFKYQPGMRYVGNPHETLIVKDGPFITNTPFGYYHIKQSGMCWIRGARNAFIGGGGPNLGDKHPLWRPFLQIVKEETGITKWNDFDKYMIAGNISPRIKEQLIKFKDENGYDGSSEWRELYKTYFRIYHPEEEPSDLKALTIG